MNIVVREAELKDTEAIIRLIGELATEGEQSSLTAAYVAEYLAAADSMILLAERQNQVVGLLSYSLRPNLYHAANSCLIEELIVHAPARGSGVGSALLTEVLARLTTTANCAEVSVSVMPDNAPALKFYRAHGLTEEVVFLEKHFVN